MKSPKALVLAGILMSMWSTAFADVWVTGNITEIRVVYSGNPANDGVVVLGTFNPSMGCPNSGFMLFSADQYFNQSYALLLAAKAAEKPIKFAFSFCTSTGYGRGNAYSMID
jgi:hypothetical protein